MSYKKFSAMIMTSTILMFVMMYLNTYDMSHIWFSEARTYMALYMGAGMAIIMLAFMLGMYKSRALNVSIFAISIIIFSVCVYLVRSQDAVADESWMKAMIPHHSIAILTSERANIDDPRVRELADEIIKAQRKEIKEMEWLIDDIAQNGIAASNQEAKERPVPKFKGQLNKGE
tara:strand:- start:3447 stop:3968 length:522 start_codon:yes stop_codon:yes gene_type:complete